MMNNKDMLKFLSRKPAPYEPSSAKFWDDAHISKGMLEAHLNTEIEAASRKPDFISRSVEWIRGLAGQLSSPRLLDLGCGPGLYGALFSQAGFQVTGVDISQRSIDYARQLDARAEYQCGNYLDIDFSGAFDVVTLIYCDFGVLKPEDRALLLNKVYKALKPGGIFVFDVCSLRQYETRIEERSWSYENGGYWSEKPYVCLYAFYRYDFCGTFADQYVIAEEDGVRCFNIYNHRFSVPELRQVLTCAGFATADFYGDVAGSVYKGESEVFCAVAGKSSVEI